MSVCVHAFKRCFGLSGGAVRDLCQARGFPVGEGAFCGEGAGEDLRGLCAAPSGEQ